MGSITKRCPVLVADSYSGLTADDCTVIQHEGMLHAELHRPNRGNGTLRDQEYYASIGSGWEEYYIVYGFDSVQTKIDVHAKYNNSAMPADKHVEAVLTLPYNAGGPPTQYVLRANITDTIFVDSVALYEKTRPRDEDGLVDVIATDPDLDDPDPPILEALDLEDQQEHHFQRHHTPVEPGSAKEEAILRLMHSMLYPISQRLAEA